MLLLREGWLYGRSFNLFRQLNSRRKASQASSSKPTVLPAHQALTTVSFLGMIAFIVLLPIKPELMIIISVAGACNKPSFRHLLCYTRRRSGHADYDFSLNSTSGVAASIAGMAIGDILLVSVEA